MVAVLYFSFHPSHSRNGPEVRSMGSVTDTASCLPNIHSSADAGVCPATPVGRGGCARLRPMRSLRAGDTSVGPISQSLLPTSVELLSRTFVIKWLTQALPTAGWCTEDDGKQELKTRAPGT